MAKKPQLQPATSDLAPTVHEAFHRALYIPPEQVEAEYNIPRQTLANDRWKGRGIPYVKRGRRVLYERAAVEKHLAECKVTVNG